MLTPVKSSRTLTIADNGIGMNRDELIENLGTIARSGTAAFMSQLTGDAKKDMSLIGQFGVGFYSAFMVADKVEVLSRKAGDSEGWRWVSDGQGSFTIEPAANVPRGARITLHMREGDDEYLEPYRLRQIVTTLFRPYRAADRPRRRQQGRDDQTASALWTRPRAEITEEQYKEFYHHVGHGFDDPWLTIHARAEGVLEYTLSVVRAVAEAVRPVRPRTQVAAQALCPPRLYHRRRHRAVAGLSAVRPRRRRQRGPAAQHQPRDAAVEPDRGAHPPAADPPRADRTRQEGGARRPRNTPSSGTISARC